ncbi:MAG TPA: LacI family DNA-binding transcriptional regulator [Pyrinomonadaceae bacterium]|nr:LacI family DNA-binding transcriptional regulator [Acidobacteriota bacterium]HQZ97024.1 LacI family DNA-binding transcriptional regulator [Pyrinomonadaceae bacterium]
MRIKDIAREAGVSTATVSHVINKTKYVSDPTRDKVEAAIKKFGYHPNAHAQMLALGKSKIIGLLVSDISNPFFPEIIKSVEAAVIAAGYNLFLLNTNYDTARTLEYVQRLIQMKVAGIILMIAEFDEALIKEAKRKKTSFVFQDLGFVGEKVSNIILDYAAGIDEAVQHLVSLGHKRIVHIGGAHEIYSAGVRWEAFVEAVKKHLPDEPEPKIYEGDFRFEGGRLAASQILAEKDLPTAVVVANDLMALGAMQEFKAAGLRVPQDISIIGFDDISFSSLSEPALTTVNSPRVEIGRRAVEALMLTVDKPNQQGIEIRIPTSLLKRDSTAPPRTGR